MRNAFANNMMTDINLSKAWLSKIIQSGGFLGALLGKLADTLMKVGVPLAKYFLAPLSTVALASAVDGAIQRKMLVRGAIATSRASLVRVGKWIALVISNEGMGYLLEL